MNDHSEKIQRIYNCGIVPVAVIDRAEDALFLAETLQSCGIGTVEVTCRTEAAIDCIRIIHEQIPQILLGAGTIKSVTMAEEAVLAGADYLVSPALNLDVATWCKSHGVLYIPGIATPMEADLASAAGFNLLKFFPAEYYGGIKTLKALRSTHPHLLFIPTGGVNTDNLSFYIEQENVLACGGSWICPRDAVAARDFFRISSLTLHALRQLHGLELAHIGINTQTEEEGERFSHLLGALLFHLPQDQTASWFVGNSIEILKGNSIGTHGHLALRVRNLPRAKSFFESSGLRFDEQRCVSDENGLKVIYFDEEFAGFAVHLLRA